MSRIEIVDRGCTAGTPDDILIDTPPRTIKVPLGSKTEPW